MTKNKKKILIVASAVSSYGYGNLIRSLEIADGLIHFGFDVFLTVFDKKAFDLCLKRGLDCSIIKKFHDISNLGHFDCIIFDLNKNLSVSSDLIYNIKKKGTNVVVVDNLNNTKDANLVIIPTAHYVGKSFDNLITGPEYVVIRKDVLKLKPLNEKSGVIARVDKEYKDKVKFLWKDVEFIEDFNDNFHKKVVQSKMVIFHLGLSCYEALYLRTPVIVLPRDENETKEIAKFYEFAMFGNISALGDGAMKIAEKIKETC